MKSSAKASDEIKSASHISLLLGHARVLTTHRVVIHCTRAALLPRVSGISSRSDFIHESGFLPTKADLVEKDSELYPILSLFLVEMRRIELLSENPSTQLSSWTVCYLEFPSGSANRHAIPSGSPFLHDRLKCERPMHVHHSNDAQSEAVVLIGGTGDPQVTALPSLRRSAKIRQP